MCGIFSYTYQDSSPTERVKDYGNKCQHRGPDNTKTLEIHSDNTNTYLMFHRLSINGQNEVSNQPLVHNNCVLMCNGEIYNYKSLAIEHGITLRTDSDCEIIIHLYMKLGMKLGMNELLNSLDGVFSFVLYDRNINQIFIGHDPFGIRSLYWFHDKNQLGIASEMKCLYDLNQNIEFYPPGSYSIYNVTTGELNTTKYYNLIYPSVINESDESIIKTIRRKLTDSVLKRLNTDVEIGCFLSGGLDSSIIASIASKRINNLKTFSIGLMGSPDLYYSEKVAQHLGLNHTIVLVTEDQMLSAIERTIKQIESYDVTTIRASVPQLLLSEYVKENSDIKVILSGEGADEVCGSYLYFHHAPNPAAFQRECIRLVSDVNKFDALRCDKTTSAAGLEVRVPFFDKSFVDYYMKINPDKKTVRNGMEKYLLRKAFDGDLPSEIIWRRKDGFSDGVSSFSNPWYKIIDEYSHKTFNMNEQDMYRHLYDKYYEGVDNIPYLWLPKWTNQGETNPSNRLMIND
jgi:asparagine synthase (glutamine-hydrolysing)